MYRVGAAARAQASSVLPPRGARSRGARPGLESLEPRTLLSLTATAISPATALQNQAYITALVGSDANGTVSPQWAALRQQLTAELNAGMPRAQVIQQLLASGPARVVRVDTTYADLLHQSPTAAQLRAGLALVPSAGDTRALEAAILGSPAYFKVRGQGTRRGVLTAMFQDVLGRAPSASELSTGLKALAGGVSTGTLARRLLGSPEATTDMILAAETLPGLPAPTPTAQDHADLARPGGLALVTARALASDALFQSLVSPPTSPPPTQLPSYPIAPGFDLTSSVQPLAVPEDLVYSRLNGIGAGADDTPWLATTEGLQIYNLETGARTLVPGTEEPISVAALSATEAYAVANPTQNGEQVLHVLNGNVTALPALPGSDTPAQVAASPDGTLWVLAGSGMLYAFSAASHTWSPVSTDGYTLKSITVGSATNIWALTTSNQALQYTTAGGFQPDGFLKTSATAIQATSDGAVWAYADGYAFMKPSFGTWLTAPAQPSGLSELYFAAGSMNRAFQVGFLNGTAEIEVISIGVVDRQPIPFPTFTGDSELAYQAISSAVTSLPGGIRSLYDTPGISWGTIENTIKNTLPLANLASVWGTVELQILTEIGDVSEVYGRLQLIQALYGQVQSINDGQLNAAGAAEGLIVNGQDSESKIRLILEDIFEAILGAVSSTGIPPAGAVLASMLASGVSDGISYYESQNGDTPGQAVTIAFSQLQTALDGIFQTGITSINTDIGTIVDDYGKLQAVSSAILNGQWPWSNQSSNDFINTVTHAYDVQFYQTLTAAGWQVIYTRYGDYIKYPFTDIVHMPPYDIYQVPLGYELGMPIEEVYFMNQIGRTTDVNEPYLGPYPGAPLLAGLTNLGNTSYNDFWTGQNGWDVIKHLKATGI
jgi:hypothetical protein